MPAKVKIQRAESAGACYGVVRALELTEKAIDECEQVSTFGEIIHNPIVVSGFAEKGVSVIKEASEASGTVVLRSHGVRPSVEEEIAARANVIDATCPYVKKAQLAARKLGEKHPTVIVVGEEGHPEVEAIVEYANQTCANVILAPSLESLPDKLGPSVGIVSQTTQSESTFSEIVSAVKSRMHKGDDELFSGKENSTASRENSDLHKGDDELFLEIKNTICHATQERQEAALSLSSKAQAMIVLGGKKSANTRRLFELCEKNCDHCFHVESKDEFPAMISEIKALIGDDEFCAGKQKCGATCENPALQKGDDECCSSLQKGDDECCASRSRSFNQDESDDCEFLIGITAGASTPATQIDELEAALRAELA
ncbi:MAG: 4-hydroxy-3-methylbut-2-enyl diphosphate reductase [Phoenicibacter congonensis]|uniref:4-hydroxy-3-methylbut-2-enyl diphosphate reductase n=1 Tax=Phoenicibacter congonensis TaxID=1944646 RepID=A0AA43UB22_9ACTN|nr:4-hydroxy-3-methylbut-2-enyl diphosphate reductase [Phoenicibacter congonensis]